jgi:hypothetical protein
VPVTVGSKHATESFPAFRLILDSTAEGEAVELKLYSPPKAKRHA